MLQTLWTLGKALAVVVFLTIAWTALRTSKPGRYQTVVVHRDLVLVTDTQYGAVYLGVVADGPDKAIEWTRVEVP
jgi:hypothetical protein